MKPTKQCAVVKIFPLFILLILLISCDKNKETARDTTYIVGEVVNPKVKYALLKKGSNTIDSVLLDENNRFLFTEKKIDEGLFTFWHGETQGFYVTPGDSITMRVNTLEFDESIQFGGNMARENNLLIQLFLENEKANTALKSFYALNPANFSKKVDSVTNSHTKLFTKCLNKVENPKPMFKDLANSSLKYNDFLFRELYLSALLDYDENTHNTAVNSSFVSYRDDINFNKVSINKHYPYYRFMTQYFDNVAYERYKIKDSFDRKNFMHASNKLEAIDEKINNDTIKNDLLRSTALQYIVNAKNLKQEQALLDQFLSINTNKKQQTEVKRIAEISTQQMPGHKIANLNLVSMTNESMMLRELLDKPSVIYFWSYTNINRNRNLHLKAIELSKKYPEYNFIAINTDKDFREWQNAVENNNYNVFREYQIEDKQSAKSQLLLNGDGKAIIVAKDGTILTGNTNLISQDIEQELLGYLN